MKISTRKTVFLWTYILDYSYTCNVKQYDILKVKKKSTSQCTCSPCFTP